MIDPGFSTPEMDGTFSADRRIELFLAFEAALADAQAEAGSVPGDAAARIGEACRQPGPEGSLVLAEGWEVGTPVAALLEWLRPQLDDETAPWLHRGATSQDVIDTALVLQMKAGMGGIEAQLARIADLLAHFADAHRDTIMTGRTLFQPALPISFGSRAALWLAPLVRHRSALDRTAAALPLQLGGPVGDLASLGPEGFDLSERVAKRLGLMAPPASWHADRTPITEATGLIGSVASSLTKIGTDICLLVGIGEASVRPGASSSIPGKKNPIDAVRSNAAARACLVAVTGLISAPPPELERSIGSWQAESMLVPLVFQTAAAAAEAIARCLESLEVVAEMAGQPGTDQALDTGLIDRVLAAHRRLSP